MAQPPKSSYPIENDIYEVFPNKDISSIINKFFPMKSFTLCYNLSFHQLPRKYNCDKNAKPKSPDELACKGEKKSDSAQIPLSFCEK